MDTSNKSRDLWGHIHTASVSCCQMNVYDKNNCERHKSGVYNGMTQGMSKAHSCDSKKNT